MISPQVIDTPLNEEGLEYETLGQEDFDFDDIGDGFYDALEEDEILTGEEEFDDDFYATPFRRAEV